MKNTTSLLLILFTTCCGFSQGWEQFYGESQSFGEAHHAIQLADGDYLILGNLEPNEPASIIRTNEQGLEKWTRTLPAGFGGKKMFLLPSGNIAIPDTDQIIEIDTAANVVISNAISPALPIAPEFRITTGYISVVHATPGVIQLWKVDFNGMLLWSKEVFVSDILSGRQGTASPDGGFVIAGRTSADVILIKFDADGNLEWVNTGGTPENDGYYMEVIATSDGGYAVATEGAGSSFDIRVFKFDASGNLLWWGEHIRTGIYISFYHFINELIETSDGGIAIVGRLLGGDYFNPTILKFSNTGDLGFFYASSRIGILYSILQTNDGGYHAVGQGNNDPTSFATFQAYALKLGSNGHIFPSYLQGQVAFDEDLNCTFSTGDLPLGGWAVKATGNLVYYDVTDADGRYSMTVDTGAYSLEVFPPNALWSPCNSPVSVTIPGIGDTLFTNFPMQAAIDCPAMQVDIATARLRRCFNNTHSIQYCNLGTVPAEDAIIELTLDSLLELVSSSIPFSVQPDNTYTFSLGDVGPNECGSFDLVVFVSCESELGQTLCMEAHAFPDTICGTPFNWSGASMMARAFCQGDTTVVLELENVGPVPTSEAIDYIVIEDQIIFLQGSEIFEPAQIETFTHPANGSTWRIISEQEPNHPNAFLPTAFVEGCGTNAMQTFSTGFVNEYPMADGDKFIDIDCEIVVDSYDPNDKTGLPKGYGTQHYIVPNTDLEYCIRFQNTGTDTAFTVVIRDTLSPFLDPASLRAGAASHNYEFDLEGDAVAIFRFENILLPDSNINEAFSHGFVNFRISQKPDVALESVIENEAAIFFDFNEPVITNQVFHTIGRNFIEVSNDINELPEGLGALLTYPNPSAGEVTFEIPSEQPVKATFVLYDQFGRLVLRKGFEGKRFLFNGHDQPKGIYFYKVEVEGLGMYSGKVSLK